MRRLQLSKPLPDRPPYLGIARAYTRSWLSSSALPPGDFVHIDHLERANRTLLIERARTYGPIFKGFMENRLAVCVLGHVTGRRLLKEHASALQPVSIQLESLFPKGFMRQMEGQCHRDYRQILVRSLMEVDLAAAAPLLETIVSQDLEAFARDPETDPDKHSWSDALSQIATGLLLCVFFGARPGCAYFNRLMTAYRNLGTNGVVWRITGKQARAFEVLRAEIQAAGISEDQTPGLGLIEQMRALSPIDETMLGNLIYMVELGRYDLRGLLRWVSKYAAEQPDWLDRIAAEPVDAPGGHGSAAEAFVMEVLRLEQSERLMRNVLRDIVFDGFLIPKGALLRICMWEAHKDEDVFRQPFTFDPSRFLGEHGLGDRFSPFGLDHHHCPLSSISVRLAMIFLRLLARTYRIDLRGSAQAVRGPYHWEPAPSFSVSLQPH